MDRWNSILPDLSRMRMEGVTRQEIAAHFGLPTRLVREKIIKLQREALANDRPEEAEFWHYDLFRPRRDVLLPHISRLVLEGYSNGQIARKLGVKRTVIKCVIRGVQESALNEGRDEELEFWSRFETSEGWTKVPEISKLWYEGLTVEEIGDRVDLRVSIIFSITRRLRLAAQREGRPEELAFWSRNAGVGKKRGPKKSKFKLLKSTRTRLAVIEHMQCAHEVEGKKCGFEKLHEDRIPTCAKHLDWDTFMASKAQKAA